MRKIRFIDRCISLLVGAFGFFASMVGIALAGWEESDVTDSFVLWASGVSFLVGLFYYKCTIKIRIEE